jgi:hypothetical protein
MSVPRGRRPTTDHRRPPANNQSGVAVNGLRSGTDGAASPADDRPVVGSRSSVVSLAALGLIAFAIGLLVAPADAWAGLLLGNLYFVSLALFGTVFVAITYLFSAGWAVAFRRVPEAMSAYLPFGAAGVLALAVGAPALYPWARPEVLAGDAHLQHTAVYLNLPFFLLRAALAFGVWILFSRRITQHSRRQDADGDLAHTRQNQVLSAWFMVLFVATFIFTTVDWLMSLEPEWTSTIFPLYAFCGLLLGGTAAMTGLVIALRERGLLPGVTSSHLYELCRLLATTSTLWAYVWFSQYLLVYYTNVPEEASYYARRLVGAGLPFMLNLLLNWGIPILLLIPIGHRRSSTWLLRVCAIVLVGRWLDLYLLIVPAVGQPSHFGSVEIGVSLGCLALFIGAFAQGFQRAAPVPSRDPYLVESVHLVA